MLILTAYFGWLYVLTSTENILFTFFVRKSLVTSYIYTMHPTIFVLKSNPILVRRQSKQSRQFWFLKQILFRGKEAINFVLKNNSFLMNSENKLQYIFYWHFLCHVFIFMFHFRYLDSCVTIAYLNINKQLSCLDTFVYIQPITEQDQGCCT